MRQYFFLGITLFVVISLVVAGLYLFGRALYSLYDDWRLGKEIEELHAEMETRRQQRQAAGEEGPGELG